MLDKILLLIILAGFVLRVPYLDYPLSQIFWWGDGSRDFLVASHIIKYSELPGIGPYNLLAPFVIWVSAVVSQASPQKLKPLIILIIFVIFTLWAWRIRFTTTRFWMLFSWCRWRGDWGNFPK